jgi:quercetin dioxygenase-like cupin family protein
MTCKSSYIHPLSSEDLSEILFHSNRKGIKRLSSKGFPVHSAVHRVDCFDLQSNKYVDMHYHDHPEINIILPIDDDLTYEVQIDGETHIINKPSAIWIPAKIKHAANLIGGKGFFVCVILTESYNAFV